MQRVYEENEWGKKASKRIVTLAVWLNDSSALIRLSMVQPFFVDPRPGPQVQVQQTADLDLDQYWTWTLGPVQVQSRSGLGPKYCGVIIFKKIICH